MTRPLFAWALLVPLTAALVPLFVAVHLPAAFLVGALLAAAGVSMAGTGLRVPAGAFVAAEAVIGCLIARALQMPMLAELARDWPVFLGSVLAVLVISCSLSLLLVRWRVLPGTTAIWGSFPGAALVMTLMAEAHGEDVRLVAFMQYLRVVCVALVASLVARLLTGATPHAALHLFPPVDWPAFGATAVLMIGGGLLGLKSRLPAGALLLPMFAGAALQDLKLMTLEVPPALLALSYTVVGWNIGARFDRATLRHVARALPRVLLATLALIGLCGLLGLGLARATGLDPLTAFLATSPGGADSVAIIAAGSPVNVPFVVALQTARFLILLVAGPPLARFLASRAGARIPS